MDGSRFRAWTRRQLAVGGGGATAALLGLTPRDRAEAKKQRCKDCCRPNGRPCKKKSKRCKATFCLNAPFTIEANWTAATSDHDTFLFVPPEDETTGSSPYIDFGCNESDSTCEDEYPFACVDQDATGPGNEVTTVYRLLPGTYEYWIELYTPTGATPAGELTIVLRDKGGRVVRRWANPAADPSGPEAAWHVFDIDGSNGSVASINQLDLNNGNLPAGAHPDGTDVCPR